LSKVDKNNFKRIVTGEFTYSQRTGRSSCSGEIIAAAAFDTIDTGFKQFMIAVDSYATTNHLL